MSLKTQKTVKCDLCPAMTRNILWRGDSPSITCDDCVARIASEDRARAALTALSRIGLWVYLEGRAWSIYRRKRGLSLAMARCRAICGAFARDQLEARWP